MRSSGSPTSMLSCAGHSMWESREPLSRVAISPSNPPVDPPSDPPALASPPARPIPNSSSTHDRDDPESESELLALAPARARAPAPEHGAAISDALGMYGSLMQRRDTRAAADRDPLKNTPRRSARSPPRLQRHSFFPRLISGPSKEGRLTCII